MSSDHESFERPNVDFSQPQRAQRHEEQPENHQNEYPQYNPTADRVLSKGAEYRQKIKTAAGGLMETKAGAEIASALGNSGPKKAMVILSLISTVCFALGIGIFPYSLLSIAAGLCLLWLVLKNDQAQTFLALLPVLLFVARFFFGESGFEGYDWITILYRVCSYGFLAIILFMDVGDVFLDIIVIEDDDISLLANILTGLGALITILATIEFFRGFGYGFNIVMFRLGAVMLWACLTLYYLFSKRPPIRKSADVYAGKQPHPFHQICGSLKNLMIGIYIAAGICIIAGPVLMISYINLLRELSLYGFYGSAAAALMYRISIYVMLGGAGFLLAAGLFLIWMNRKIRLRSPAFLLYLEYACVVLIAASIAIIFCSNVLIGIFLTLASVIGSWFLIKWISTSVQIRTYMGSAEYLRYSAYYLLNKKAPRPQSADEEGYAPQVVQTRKKTQQQAPPAEPMMPTPHYEKTVEQDPIMPIPHFTSQVLPFKQVMASAEPNASERVAANAMEQMNYSKPVSQPQTEAKADEAEEWGTGEATTEIPTPLDESEEWEIEKAGTFPPLETQEEKEQQIGWQFVMDHGPILKNEAIHTIPVRPDICCVCGNFLRNGYAVLMRDETGAEARIDEKCWNAIQAILDDVSKEGNEALLYLESQLPFIDPMVSTPISEQISQYRTRMELVREPVKKTGTARRSSSKSTGTKAGTTKSETEKTGDNGEKTKKRTSTKASNENKLDEKGTITEPEKAATEVTPTPRRRRNPARNAAAMKTPGE